MAPCSDAARRVLADAIRARVFPAAAVDVGSSAGPLWQDALGTLAFDAGASAAHLDTPFDLASLTKADRDDDGRDAARRGRRGDARRARVVRAFAEWRGRRSARR